MKNPCTAHLSLPISHRSPSDNIYSPPSLSPCSTIRVEIFLPSGYSSALQPCSLTLPVGCTPACLSLKREIDGEQRGRRRGRRGRGVAQGGRAEGHGGGPGPACQGGGQHDAAEVPARARPRRGQGLGDAAQVRGVEAGGRAGRRRRRDAGRSGADGAVAGQGPHGRRRPRRPPRPARLPRQALVRRPRHGGAQACVHAHAADDPKLSANAMKLDHIMHFRLFFAGLVVYLLDRISARIPRGQDKFMCIVDLKGWGYPNSDVRAYIAAIEIMQGYYPERLGKALMVHVPYIFMKAWKM
uniref:CRAL-TRIO domain-containing protein n=1 Tax=Triticum urartu TaxID=4572 RepID=A0A8R7U1S4_TRIUA